MGEGGMSEFDVIERLEIISIAKRKAIKHTIITDIICFIVFWLSLIVAGGEKQSTQQVVSLMLAILVIIMMISVFLMIGLQKYFQLEEIRRRSNEYVETYLSREELVKVALDDAKAYREFVFKLEDKGQFYAQIVSEDKVKIYFKYHDETEESVFETIDKSAFKCYYWVQTEQQEEDELSEKNNS